MANEETKTAETPADKTAAPRRRAGGRKKSAARARKTTRKTAARKTAARKTSAAAARPVRRSSRAGGGSARLADSLVGLLTDVGAEVATVSALSAAIDEASRSLQGQLSEFAERIATLSRLRASVSGGTLAAFLDETLVPQRPAELEALTERIRNAQSATI